MNIFKLKINSIFQPEITPKIFRICECFFYNIFYFRICADYVVYNYIRYSCVKDGLPKSTFSEIALYQPTPSVIPRFSKNVPVYNSIIFPTVLLIFFFTVLK